MISGRSRRAMIWKQDVSPWASFSRCWSLDVLVWTASTRLKRVWYATTFVLFESEDILSEALSLKCGWFTAYSSHWGWFQTGLPPSCNLFIAADASQQRSPLSSGGQHLNEITFGLLLSVWNVEKQQVLGKMNELRLHSTSAVGMFDHEDFMVCQRLLFILFANIAPLKHEGPSALIYYPYIIFICNKLDQVTASCRNAESRQSSVTLARLGAECRLTPRHYTTTTICHVWRESGGRKTISF